VYHVHVPAPRFFLIDSFGKNIQNDFGIGVSEKMTTILRL